MNSSDLPKPAALYARVSSDRQDVDLSVAAQLRALRDFAERNGYRVVREYVDEAESGRIAKPAPVPQDAGRSLGERVSLSGNPGLEVSPGSRASESTPSPSSRCSGGVGSGLPRSPSTPTTRRPAS